MLEITNYISNDYKAIESTTTIEMVKDFFSETYFSHFPIIEEGVYIGCLPIYDLDTFEMNKTVKHYRYTLEGFYVRTNMIWLDVLEVFARNHSNVVPVLDDTNKYVGYYEITDVIKLFYETPFLKELGGIIIVERATVDFSVSQIVQIVESNNGKVLGLFVSDTSVDKIQVTVKLALGGMNEIIQTFRRYGYDIISEHQEDNYINNLRERSDYLDKYLNL